jgi:hypothetical protein
MVPALPGYGEGLTVDGMITGHMQDMRQEARAGGEASSPFYSSPLLGANSGSQENYISPFQGSTFNDLTSPTRLHFFKVPLPLNISTPGMKSQHMNPLGTHSNQCKPVY